MKKKLVSALLVTTVVFSLITGCGSKSEKAESSTGSEAGQKDKITAILPPVTAAYQDKLADYISAYQESHPDIEIEAVPASWEDFSQKLDVQVNAGSPPDIAFVGYADLPKYIDSGLVVNLSDYADKEQIEDFDKEAINYMTSEGNVYGFPGYISVQSVGGNKKLLEAAGIDWKKIQQEGWTYEEFRKACAAGTVKEGDTTSQYGLVVAASGTSVKDYFNIFTKNAGMPAEFNEDLKYAYTSKNMLSVLQSYEDLIADGSAPNSMGTIDGTKKNNMLYMGQAMMICKGTPTGEKAAYDNTKSLENNDGKAVEGSVPVEYVVLPAPVFDGGSQNAQGNVDGYIVFSADAEKNKEHVKNAIDFAYYMASGTVAAEVCRDLYITPVSAEARKAEESMPAIEGKSQENTDTLAKLQKEVAPARTDIPADKLAEANKIREEVIYPKLQSLLSGESTAQEVYDAICSAAYDSFGKDNCE